MTWLSAEDLDEFREDALGGGEPIPTDKVQWLVLEIDALKMLLGRAQHALVTLHGTYVTDRPDIHPEVTWRVDESALLNELADAAGDGE